MNALQLNIQPTPRTSLELDYYKLAILLDKCQSKEASENILLTNNHAALVYNKEPIHDFVSQTLFHFIRSRLAFFQMNFLWFQKETLQLIDFWLAHEREFVQYFGNTSVDFLTNILAFGLSNQPTKLPDLLLTKQENIDGELPVFLKAFLQNIRKDKLVFLELMKTEG